VILSTHIVSDIETIANRVIMFKDHKLLTNDAPASVCKMLDGMVYETDDNTAIPPGSLMLTERQDGGRTITRFACDGECPASATAANPNLEDVFLYIFRDEAA
jgi:ABC-type multidrug transport system ATPase subunit